MVWSVDNKVVLVTGGAAGVGAGLVRELLARNAACGTVTSTLKALSIMRADVEGSGGAVINVSSSHAFKPSPLSVYNASKAAVLQFTNFLAGNESGMKVRIITVCLGPTDTALLHKRNLNNFAKDAGLTSEPQRVESAVNGIIEVIQRADNGTTWVISNNDMARDITTKVTKSFKLLSEISEPL
ncbi:alcohol dehydrogenase 2 isoform X3 [Pieris rapae]|uniref:alcohol dehydrogenase 2 isoform X3 n=1 Tax=Pieris rapae TaxID=64459 RepID=UPI001E27F811|nr:alcohol dehydrogenase 2 isoform X3 [Pieris rapae]